MSKLSKALKNISTKVFSDAKLKKGLNNDALFNKFKKARESGESLTKPEQNEIAQVVKEWALDQGAVSYTHWFSPLRDGNGEKHDSLIDLNYKTGDVKVDFSGAKLFSGETDGSSFPNGLLRSTHTAGAYTSWDTRSPLFLRGKSIYIPTSLATYHGESLDYKTPLLKAESAIVRQGGRVLAAIGEKDTKLKSCNGWEQEFFLTTRALAEKRPDILETGRTLIGNLPPHNQQTSTSYFGLIPVKVKKYLRDIQSQLWSYGISIQTLHNEVAPGQHEFAPIFTSSTVSADTNSLAMEVLKQEAYEHDLSVILTEKPFAGLNGSGKHNNWGLNKTSGENLLIPGETKQQQRRFMTFVAAIVRAIHLHGDLLRISIASAHNDWRLGAQEAPPSIISIYLGEAFSEHIDRIINGGPLEGYGGSGGMLDFGAPSLLHVTPKGVEDRNRTSPFPFCGNRFEFRAVGGAANINRPLTYLNTIVADSFEHLADCVEAGEKPEDVTRRFFKDHKAAIFNGNGYSKEWVVEAEKRGLFNLPSTVEALAELTSKKNLAVFKKQKVLTNHEVLANQLIFYEQYNTQVRIEANTLSRMIRTGIIPAVLKDLRLTKQAALSPELAKKLNSAKVSDLSSLLEEQNELDVLMKNIEDETLHKEAVYLRHKVIPQMNKVRKYTDSLELQIDEKVWPFPTYAEILKGHH